MLISLCPVFSQNEGALESTKKEAFAFFEAGDYARAYKLYSQLVANYPKDPEYNFKLGVCMIYAEPDKKKCFPYLLFAEKTKNVATEDVLFYIGKAYHVNYQFDEAIKNYNAYKNTATSAKLKKLAVDREIKSCNSGKRLLSNMSDLVVKTKKELNEEDYFRSYELKDIGGKLLVKPPEFTSSADKKQNEKSVVYVPRAGNRIYYSSYGSNTDNGKDIYYADKLPDGRFSKGKKVSGINTEFDEDYPFLHPNGKTIYFASKGHNSMGGYDIFKSDYIEASDSWSQPVNLEFPINSPDDDFLYVTDSLEKTAYFSTGRQCEPGKTEVLKINTERQPIDLVVIDGEISKENETQSLKSRIIIKNLDTKKDAGIYFPEDNGDYQLNVPNGAKLLITVETPGFKTQSQEITLPLAEIAKPFKQTISYVDSVLKITNNFDVATTDDNYLQYLKEIEKKAKLNVNEGNYSAAKKPNVVDSISDPNKNPQLIKQSKDSTLLNNSPQPGLDNKQLANMAKEDAVLSKNEAVQLKQDSNDALEVGQQQKSEAEKKLLAANESLKNGESIENVDEKKLALEKANILKQEAETQEALANKILDFGKTLDADAAAKEKEAALNEAYAIAVEKTINAKNTDKNTIAQLESLQNQIKEMSAQKNASDDLFNGLKANADEKQKQIGSLEKTNSEVKASLEEINTEIKNNDAELATTKKKKDKQIIIAQSEELKTQASEKEKQIATNDLEIKKLNEGLLGLKNELDIANKIKTETIAPLETPAIVASGDNLAVVEPPIAAVKKTNKTPAVNAAKENNQPDYSPITAASGPEAAAKLEKLSTQLNANDNELFDYNAYQNPEAQNLRIEADAKINDAILQQKKLKEVISASKQSIAEASKGVATPAALSTQADDFAIKAEATRTQANKLTGKAKQTKLAEALKLAAKADDTYLLAAAVVESDNQSVFNTNNENLQLLVNENKTDSAINPDVRKLNEEANEAFKKAAEIRKEAASLPSAGAKLGNLSNAEEIEATALVKQQKALELAKKTNPTLTLKTASTSSNVAKADTSSLSLNTQLQTVNAGMSELAAIKISSYQKLYDANTIETQELLNAITVNQTILNKTPGLKSEFISGKTKIEKAENLKKVSDAALNTNDQLNNLTAAIKKQIEAVKQLSGLNAALNLAASKNETLLAKQNQQKNNAVVTNQNNVLIKADETSIDTMAAANTKIIQINELAQEDTTATQLINYFSSAKNSIENPQLEASVKKSLNAINAQEQEINLLLEKINNPSAVSNTTAEVDVDAMIAQSNKLVEEAEQLSIQAFETKKASERASGSEKDTLLAKSAQFDNLSNQKMLEAAQLVENANTADFKSNDVAISEMLLPLKNDNAELFAETNAINKELTQLSEQTKQLRREANSLTNNAAKLGALSNVEEQEEELLSRQIKLIKTLKKQYPNYEQKPFIPQNEETPELLAQKKFQLREKQYTEYTNLTNAFSLGFESDKNSVPLKLSVGQTKIKKNAEELNAESKRLLIEASNETDENKKIKLLALSAKSGQAAVLQLSKIVRKDMAIVENTTAKPKTAPLAAANKKTTKKNSNTDPYAALAAFNQTNENDNTVDSTNNSPDVASEVGKTKPKDAQKQRTKDKNTLSAENKVVAENTNTETKVVANVNRTNTNKTKIAIKIDGLEVTPGNAYSEKKPIPLDVAVEEGLVFRVQIGAFKTKLPDNAFKGLSPLNGETAGNGYIRYTAGNFKRVENANAVKNDLRALGYSDAFVVVYFNGKRITMNEALTQLEKEGKPIDSNAPQTAGITANSNIPKVQTAVTSPADVVLDNTVVVKKELEQINGLLFTVQIGVYTKQITRRQLYNLRPIFTEKLSNGLFRYTAGIYNNAERLINDKRKVIDLGVKDAFVSAYLNGTRIPFADGKSKQAQDSSIKMEAEDPIIFEGAGIIDEPPTITASAESPITNTVQPFKNNVTTYPAATPENGIKDTEEGLTFKVQIGAYSKQVPNDVAAKYSAITTWPIENKLIRGLFIYNIGRFNSAKFAKTLRDEAIQLGIGDAFISVYNDGVKLYGEAAGAALLK